MQPIRICSNRKKTQLALIALATGWFLLGKSSFLTSPAFASQFRISSEIGVPLQSSAKIDFHTGKDLEEALGQVISVSQRNQNLRDLIRKISSDRGVAIFLDRRIDPGQTVNVQIQNKTVWQVLYLLADQAKGGSGKGPCAVTRIEDVIYFGPRASASRFYFAYQANRESLKKIKNRATRQNWLRRDEMSWQRLAEPRKMATEIVKENEIDMHGALDLPHDVWADGAIAKTSVLGRLSLLAIGFEKQIMIDETANRFQLADAPRPESIVEVYSSAGMKGLFELIGQVAKNAEIEKKGSSIRVSGSPVEHYLIRRAIVLSRDNPNAKPHPLASKRVSMDTEARVGDILNTVAKQLSIKLEFDPALNEVLQKRIKISIKQGTYNQLVAKALDSTGLDFELTDKKLLIKKNE